MLKVFTILFLTFFIGETTSAQSYSFKHYQVENGLSHNMVYCSAQDSTGFVWFGTKDGLNRFDGYRFKHYNIKAEGHSMNPSMISCILVDSKNKIWIGSQSGIYFFNNQTETLVPLIDTLPFIKAMAFDNNNNLWFISVSSVYKYQLTTKKLTSFPASSYFPATSLCFCEKGNLWVSTTDGYLHRYNPASNNFTAFNLFEHSSPTTSNWIQKIYCNGKNGIFVGTTSQGLKEFDVNTLTYKDVLIFNPDKTAIFIRDIVKYANDEYWIATESGIFIYNTATKSFNNLKKKFEDPYSLSDNAVYTLCRDKEGGVWAGTYFGGVNYYSRQSTIFQKYYPNNSESSISGNVVREICEDHAGNLWIGTEDAGLNKLNLATGKVTQFKPTGDPKSIAYSNIHGLLLIGNELWIGTFDHGLDIMDTRTGNIVRRYNAGSGNKKLKSNFIVCMMQTKNGDIYIGSSNSLFKYDKKNDGFDLVTETPPYIFVSCMLEDHEGVIWVGTNNNGFYYFNPANGKKGHIKSDPNNPNSLTNNIINTILEDESYNLWIATDGGGLCKLNKEKTNYTYYNTSNGLPSNFTFKILTDKEKNLWITTTKGLVKLNPVTNSITSFTKDNGLLSDQFNYNSGYKDAAGNMYLGCVKGMIKFNPNEIAAPAFAFPIVITGFQVQNEEASINSTGSYLKQSILLTDEIVLPHNKSSFSIDFASLSYTSPEMTEYSYFMKGLDKEWTTVKPNRKIYFTGLAPGKYIFKLKAAVNGKWSEQVKELTITIMPPFWATSWAYILYVLAVITLAYYLFRTYHFYIESKKKKEIYEAKIDFFTNIAHEIKTPLTLIKGPVENIMEQIEYLPELKDDLVMMEKNTNRLVALITQMLDFRKTETNSFSLDLVKMNISELLRETCASFSNMAKKKKLQYNINIPQGNEYIFADEEAMTKIVSNLLNNAVKYASTIVNVRLIADENNKDELLIEFENDGVKIPEDMNEKVFEPFFRLKDGGKSQGTGIGLALAKSLTELHKGKLYIRNSSEGMNTFILQLKYTPSES